MANKVSPIPSLAQEPCEAAATSEDQGSPSAPASSAWPELLTANASFVVWLVFLAFGGALLSLYYAHIQYFPDLEWEESLTYLVALSILGGSVAAIYGLLLYVPGVMWSEFLIHDSELEPTMCYRGRGQEPCYLTVAKFMGLPFLGLMVVSHVAGMFGFWYIIPASGVALAIISWRLWVQFHSHLREKCPKRVTEAETQALLLKYVGSFDVSAIASLASLLILTGLVKATGTPEETWPMLLLCTILVTVTNFLVAVQHRDCPGRAAVTAVLATLVLLACGEFAADGKLAVSRRLMELFGIGSRTEHTLAVNQQGLKALEELGITERLGNESGVALIKNARILSRLGKEYYVQVGRLRVAIPRAHIDSWSTLHSVGNISGSDAVPDRKAAEEFKEIPQSSVSR